MNNNIVLNLGYNLNEAQVKHIRTTSMGTVLNLREANPALTELIKQPGELHQLQVAQSLVSYVEELIEKHNWVWVHMPVGSAYFQACFMLAWMSAHASGELSPRARGIFSNWKEGEFCGFDYL
jgi:hypothetical protein